MLQSLNLGWPDTDRPLLGVEPHHVQFLDAICTLTSLHILDVRGLLIFDDTPLRLLSIHCKLLDTMHIPDTNVSASGFVSLRYDAQALPRLRVLEYRNELFGMYLDAFFSRTLE